MCFVLRNLCYVHSYGLSGMVSYSSPSYPYGVSLPHLINSRAGIESLSAFVKVVTADYASPFKKVSTKMWPDSSGDDRRH